MRFRCPTTWTLFSLVLLLAVVCAATELGGRTLGNHECFVTVAARNMLQSDNWVVPIYNDQIRLQKTPLNYWLTAFSFALSGKVDEVTARLPSAVLAVVSVVAIFCFVSRYLNSTAALTCAATWCTSLGYIQYSHSARPEMSLTVFVCLAMLSFFWALHPPNLSDKESVVSRLSEETYSSWKPALLFWFFFALSMLAKGPAPLLVLCVPLAVYVWSRKLTRAAWKRLHPLTGSLLFLLLVLPWPLLLLEQLKSVAAAGGVSAVGSKGQPLAVWLREFVFRFLGTYAPGQKTPFYYGHVMFVFAAPWCVFVPLALLAPFIKTWSEQKRRLMFFCWIWFVVDVAVMSISGGKRMHYILPAMPALMILVGLVLHEMIFERNIYSLRFQQKLLTGHLVVVAIGALTLTGLGFYELWARDVSGSLDFIPSTIPPTKLVVCGVLLAVLGAAVGKAFHQAAPLPYALVLFGSVGIAVALFCVAFNHDYNNPKGRLLRNVGTTLAQTNSNLIFYGKVSPVFVFYFERPVPVVASLEELQQAQFKNRTILAASPWFDELQAHPQFKLLKQWTIPSNNSKKAPFRLGMFCRRTTTTAQKTINPQK